MSQVPQPQRVLPLDAGYGLAPMPAVPARPGILTAVGVTSIVLACLGTVASCAGIFAVTTMVTALRAANAAAIAHAPAAFATPMGPAPEVVAPRGYSRRQQLIVIAGLVRTHPLSLARRQILQKLLAEHGQDMFIMSPDQLTPNRVASNVSQSGQLPGFNAKRGNDYYIIGNGRIELADDHAVFVPSSGGGEAIRVYQQPAGVATPMPAPPPPPVTHARSPSNPIPTISDGSVALVTLNAVLAALLAIYLFICGLVVLRDSSAGRLMHLIYAFVKIPLAISGGLASWMIARQIFSSVPSSKSGHDTFVAGAIIGFIVFLGCVYPIILLIVLNLRTARDYYRRAR